MLQQFIQRHLRPLVDRTRAPEQGKAASPLTKLRSTDWLLGGSLVTFAVVFVAGLLGLRSSTADLEDQSRTNTRDLATLKSDTLERITGISGDLARTNQTLTDLLALRSGEAGARAPSANADGTRAGESKGSDGKGSDGKGGNGKGGDGKGGESVGGESRIGTVRSAARTAPAATPKPVARPEPVRLSPITVRRRPERERAIRRAKALGRPAAAARSGSRTAIEALRARREAILRELRLRRLARR